MTIVVLASDLTRGPDAGVAAIRQCGEHRQGALESQPQLPTANGRDHEQDADDERQPGGPDNDVRARIDRRGSAGIGDAVTHRPDHPSERISTFSRSRA